MVTKPTHPSAIPATLPVSSVHLQWDMETSHFLRAPQWRPHKSLHWSASVISNNVKIVVFGVFGEEYYHEFLHFNLTK